MIDRVLDRDNLRAAWLAVEANKGAPGIDQVTLARWGRNWEANLMRLRAQVLANTYRPRRPRRFKVLKKDGTYRELSILTVTDRVLQRAVLNVLEPIFEQRFLNCSFGYRPNRSVANAVTAVVRYRERGLRGVLRADVQDCFDSLDHDVMMEHVRQAVQAPVALGLIAAWLKAGRKAVAKPSPASGEAARQVKNRAVGIPLGAVISPLLCNVVLHQMDVDLTCAGWTLVRYADDLAVLTPGEAEANAARVATEAALAKLQLRLNAHKTQITSFEAGFVFLGVEFRGDQYSYVRQNKRITVQGPTTRILYRQPPEFY